MSFYQKTFECKVCDNIFKEYRIRKSQQRMEKVDTDFAPHCIGPNIIHYDISVCPKCGYSFSPNFTSISSRLHQLLKILLAPSTEDFSGERTHELAVLSYQRALWCAFLKQEKEIMKASLYLHLAWIHRFAGEDKEEKINLKNALIHYHAVHNSEKVSQPKVMYLMGELYRRLGNDNEAVRWFSEMIGKHENRAPQLAKMARHSWQVIREVKDENDFV